MYGYIYKTIDLNNNKIYIGKKEKSYFVSDYYGSGLKIQTIISKCLENNIPIETRLTVEIIDTAESLSELNEKEKYWIKKFKSQNIEFGYNISDGGDGGDIISNLDEAKQKERGQKISKALKGKKRSKKTLKNVSEGLKKYWANDQNRKIRSAINKQRYIDDPTLKLRINKSQKETFSDPTIKNHLSDIAKKRWENEDYVNKQHLTRKSAKYKTLMATKHPKKGWIWMHNDIKNKQIPPTVIDEYEKNGWLHGKLPLSIDTKLKMSQSAKNRKKSKDEI